MARRAIDKLTPLGVKNAKEPGLYGDGRGLYLNVGPTGSKSWLFRYMLNGRSHEMGLGPYPTFGLGDARQRAEAVRRLKHDGIDPLEERRAAKARRAAEAAAAAASLVTFRKAAQDYIETNRAAWRNGKHGSTWTSSLENHVFPVIGDVAVSEVDTGQVTKVLLPIWTEKPETASRIRGRIEIVLDFARVQGWRSGENPARWKGHLDNVLPKPSKVRRVEHHPAMPWREVGAFMEALKQQDGGFAAPALRFTILTASRTGEVIGARWSEIDLQQAVWSVPGSRMKSGLEHRVALSEAALAILREVAAVRDDKEPNAFVFPGGKGGKAPGGLSNMAMLTLLGRMGYEDLTVHGFRSSFSDWASETTRHEHIVIEKALAHTIDSKVEAAYRRGDLFEKRRRLMEDWAAFCGRPSHESGTVVPLRTPETVA